MYLETFTNGFISQLLNIIYLLSIVFGISIIINKNPIVSILFLIFLFSSVSIYLISIGVSFIGISYLLVYVGAVSILFIFILMLINIRISELLSATANSIPLSIFITISFFFPLAYVFSFNTSLHFKNIDYFLNFFNTYNSLSKGTLADISFATSKN